MSSPLMMPVTLVTASILALICMVLAARVMHGRVKYRVAMGDADNAEMVVRMRTHANFVEYVPLILILMGILEISEANPMVLMTIGGLLVIFRVMHAFGMPRPVPNIWRAGGALGTYLILGVVAVWGLVTVITA